jgi:5-(carboxyamino)imidazole ribonucleotide mutase
VKNKSSVKVGIIMGSESDFPTMQKAAEILKDFKVNFEIEVVSAHRTPQKMYDYSTGAAERGLKVIIAGAGGAAHLPGMVASLTPLPVIGVPVETKSLKGMDSLLSIAQMPPGIPVATMAIGNAANAGLLAVRILALDDPTIAKRLEQFHKKQILKVEKMNQNIKREGSRV